MTPPRHAAKVFALYGQTKARAPAARSISVRGVSWRSGARSLHHEMNFSLPRRRQQLRSPRLASRHFKPLGRCSQFTPDVVLDPSNAKTTDNKIRSPVVVWARGGFKISGSKILHGFSQSTAHYLIAAVGKPLFVLSPGATTSHLQHHQEVAQSSDKKEQPLPSSSKFPHSADRYLATK